MNWQIFHRCVLFPRAGKSDLYYFQKVKNIKDRNRKMCLFPLRGKNELIFYSLLNI